MSIKALSLLPAAVPCPGQRRAQGTTSPSLVPTRLALPISKARQQPGDLGTCNGGGKIASPFPLPLCHIPQQTPNQPAARQCRPLRYPPAPRPVPGPCWLSISPGAKEGLGTPQPGGDSFPSGPVWWGSPSSTLAWLGLCLHRDPVPEPVRIPLSQSRPNSRESWTLNNTLSIHLFPTHVCAGSQDPTEVGTGTLGHHDGGDPKLRG